MIRKASLSAGWILGLILVASLLGGCSSTPSYELTEGQSAAVLAPPAAPLRLRLDPVAPTPLRDSATLSYELSAEGRVRLEIFDPAGRCVRRLIDATQYAGRHTVPWDARDDFGRRLPRGVYSARLRCGEGAVALRRLVLN